MGGVSGSAVADAAMECRILGPEMTKRATRRAGPLQSTVCQD